MNRLDLAPLELGHFQSWVYKIQLWLLTFRRKIDEAGALGVNRVQGAGGLEPVGIVRKEQFKIYLIKKRELAI